MTQVHGFIEVNTDQRTFTLAAVSGLVIHCVPGHWPEPITDLISMFQPQLTGPNPNYRSLTLLLELLLSFQKSFLLFY